MSLRVSLSRLSLAPFSALNSAFDLFCPFHLASLTWCPIYLAQSNFPDLGPPDDFLDMRKHERRLSVYSEEFKAKALKALEECSGSCIKAARRLGIVGSKTLQRRKSDPAEPPRKKHRHPSAVRRRSIAKLLEGGAAVSAIAREYGVSVTAVRNIRSESRPKGAWAFMDTEERIKTPEMDPSGLPDNVEVLERRCAGPEPGDAILSQTIGTLKKTRASTRRR